MKLRTLALLLAVVTSGSVAAQGPPGAAGVVDNLMKKPDEVPPLEQPGARTPEGRRIDGLRDGGMPGLGEDELEFDLDLDLDLDDEDEETGSTGKPSPKDKDEDTGATGTTGTGTGTGTTGTGNTPGATGNPGGTDSGSANPGAADSGATNSGVTNSGVTGPRGSASTTGPVVGLSRRDAGATPEERLQARRAQLQRQAELARARRAAERRAAARDLEARRDAIDERWRPLAETLDNDPDAVTSDEWTRVTTDALDHSDDRSVDIPGRRNPRRESRTTAPHSTPRVVDEFGDEVPPEDPDYDHYLEENERRREEEAENGGARSPNDVDPIREGSPLERLRDRIANGERPKNMSRRDWSRVADEFENDVAEFEGERADTEERIKEREELEDRLLEELLKETEEDLKELARQRDEMTEEERAEAEEEMRRRLRELDAALDAERSELVDLLNDEKAGEESERPVLTRYGGLRGAWDAVTKAFKAAFGEDGKGESAPDELTGDPSDDVAVDPDAPLAEDAESEGDPEQRRTRPYDDGLPWPEWTEVDRSAPDSHEALVKGRLLEAQRNLDELAQQYAEAPQQALERDKKRWKRFAKKLYTRDLLRGDARKKSASAKRKALRRKARQKLDETRPQRVEKRQAELRKRMVYWQNEIAHQEQRLAEMNAADDSGGDD